MNMNSVQFGAKQPYAMLSGDYIERAILVAVHQELIAGGGFRLVCADERSEVALSSLVDRLSALAPRSLGAADWAKSKIDQLMAKNFEGDLWYSQLDSGEPVLLAKKNVLDTKQMTIVDAARHAHFSVVSQALQENKLVPEEVLAEYRQTFEAMSAERQLN